MKTRSMTRRVKQAYRSHLKTSQCRGKRSGCTRRIGCKKTRSGRRKSYCRKMKNRHA